MTTLVLVVLLAASHPKHSSPVATPSAAVQTFYEWRLSQVQGGLPNRTELEQLRPFISRKLHGRFDKAVTNIERLSRRYRAGDKLPCGEGGDWFDSLFEWPAVQADTPGDPVEHFEVSQTTQLHATKWRVSIRFWFDTTPRVEWEDTVVVIQEEGRFVIDDVIYAGVGLYNRSGTLSDLVASCARLQ